MNQTAPSPRGSDYRPRHSSASSCATCKRRAPNSSRFGAAQCVDFENHDYDFRGRATNCELRVAYFMSGDLEIELIQPPPASPHREFLDRGREGLHHLQFQFRGYRSCIK